MATISRLLKIIDLFCRISSVLEGSFAKETYDFMEPTNCSHPVHVIHSVESGKGSTKEHFRVSKLEVRV